MWNSITNWNKVILLKTTVYILQTKYAQKETTQNIMDKMNCTKTEKTELTHKTQTCT